MFNGQNDIKKEITFFECKLKDLSYNQSLKIFEELKEKTPYVKWYDDNRKEQYGTYCHPVWKNPRAVLKRQNHLGPTHSTATNG